MNSKTAAIVLILGTLLVGQMLVGVASASTEVVTEPQVDKIVFKIISGTSQQVTALQSGTIDIIGNALGDTSYYSILDADENIDVTRDLRNGYAWMMINCQRYPLNITAFRRAIAFALDKEYISSTILSGFAQPLDSVIPADNPLSIESELETTYYSKSISIGQQLLSDAGFENIDGDSYLEAPDGSNFDITVETGSNFGVAPAVGEAFEDALNDLNINVTLDTSYSYDYISRVTIYKDYDIALMGRNYEDLDVRWLVDEFHSDNYDSSIFNAPGFVNNTYDDYCTQFIEAITFSELETAATKLQEILWFECPVIICYQNHMIYANRNDEFGGFVLDPLEGTSSWWTNMKVHPLSGTGGTLEWSLDQDINSFNYLVYPTENGKKVYRMLLDSLLVTGVDEYMVPNLAIDWEIQTHDDDPAIIDGHMKITFDLLQGTGCSDGSELTSSDVKYSLDFCKDAGSPLSNGLDDLVATSAPSPYIFTCEFSKESYLNLISVGLKPIFNKAYLEAEGVTTSNYNSWNPDPTTEEYVTTGPFKVTGYTSGEYLEISQNGNYVRNEATSTVTTSTGTTSTSTTNTITTNTNTTDRPDDINDVLTQVGIYLGVGVVVVVLIVVILRRR